MATKKATEKRSKKSTKPEILGVKIVLETSEEIPSYYVNYAEVIHSRHEFGLYAVQLPTKLSTDSLEAARASGEIHIEPTLHLVVPPTLIPGLIDALETQKNSYEKEFGAIQQEGKKK